MRKLWLMVALVFLAALTHFHAIETRSLWADEGWTLLLSDGDSIAEVVQTLAYDQHPPVYFVLMHFWKATAGDSEYALRALSAWFGILSVAGLYQLGKQTLGWQVGVMAAALLAVWDFSIDLSQDARQYSMLLFLAIFSTLFYFRYRQNATRWNGVGWFAFSIAGLLTQYMIGVVLVFQLLHVLLTASDWQVRRDLVIRWGLICAAFLPWFPAFIRQNQIRWTDPLYYQSGLPNTEATFILMRDALLTQQFGLVIGLLLLGVVVVRYVPRVTLHAPTATLGFMAVWLVGFVALIVYLNESREILRLRIFIVVLPPLLLLVAHGLANLQRLPRLFLLAVLLAVNLVTIDTRQSKPPWREVTQNVTALHQAGEPVLMDIWVGDFPTRYYIQKQMGADTPWLSIRELKRSAGDAFLPQLFAYLEGEDAFWLIRWNDTPDPYDDILAQLGFQRTYSPYEDHEGNQLFSHRYDRYVPEDVVATFGEGINLMKSAIYGELAWGQTVDVALWWVADQTPAVDYSISVFLTDGEQVIPFDRPPLNPTSQWQPGQIQYDQHTIVIPADLPAGEYQLGVRIYWYVEPENLLPVVGSDTPFVTIRVFE